MKREWILRWSFFVVGLMVLAFGIALTIEGKVLGIGPWDVFHYGLFLKMGLTIGSWSIITGFILLAISSIVMAKLPKIGAFLNMLLLGLFIDLFIWLLPNIESYAGAVMYFVFGVILIGYGIGLYVSADLGSGPRDSIMMILVEKTCWSVSWVRNSIEILVLLLGGLLGGPVGIGTFMIALFLGPIVGKALPQCKKMLEYFLEGKKLKNIAA